MSATKTKTKQVATDGPKKTTKAKKGAAPARAEGGEMVARKLSALAAAARVLQETDKAMTCPELIEAMKAKGYWTSPGGQTPAATLHSALTRDITRKGKDARFQKTGRGMFARTGVA